MRRDDRRDGADGFRSFTAAPDFRGEGSAAVFRTPDCVVVAGADTGLTGSAGSERVAAGGSLTAARTAAAGSPAVARTAVAGLTASRGTPVVVRRPNRASVSRSGDFST